MIDAFVFKETKRTNDVVASRNNTSLFKVNFGWQAVKKEYPTKGLHIGRNVGFPDGI